MFSVDKLVAPAVLGEEEVVFVGESDLTARLRRHNLSLAPRSATFKGRPAPESAASLIGIGFPAIL